MDLAVGRQVVRFTEVASQIDPTSVHFVDLADPTGTKVVEQNYEFDLVSADKLLGKYVDKGIRILTQDGGLIEGKLLSFDGAQIVIGSPEGGIQVVPRYRNVRDIQFTELPAGLLTKPTLVWLVDAKKAGQHLVKLAYMTGGFSWRADYTVELAADEKGINMGGWVTVMNNSGSRYHDAQLKLVAGDVHKVIDQLRRENQLGMARGREMASKGPAVEEKAFGEYHMYTVKKRVELNDRQTKQIEFMEADGVPVTKAYFFRAGSRMWLTKQVENADVVVKFKNDEKSNLGVPLPKGVVRLFKRDSDGQLQMLGQTSIDHTPKDEKMEFAMGKAFDVIGERKVVALRQPAYHVLEEDIEITLRNHKPEDVTVNVEEQMWRFTNWQLLKQSMEMKEKKDWRTVAWEVPVKANTESKLTYTVRYTW